MPCRATQDRRVMVESSDKMWSTGEGNGKSLLNSYLENSMNSMKRQNGMTLKNELPRSVGAQYATGDQWRKASQEYQPTLITFIQYRSPNKSNVKPIQYSCLEKPMNSMKRQKDRTLTDELPGSVGTQYATGYSGEITQERMKGWSQSKTTPSCERVWWWKKYYTVRTVLHRNLEC